MGTTNIIKHTMIASLGFVVTNSTDSSEQSSVSSIQNRSVINNTESPSSTRFNNSQRFSLEQLKLNKRKLRALNELKKGWNGYAGEPINEVLLSKIEELISNLDYQPQIFPTGRGSIQIEKYIDDYNLFEIEISTGEVFAYSVKNGTEVEKNISISEINDFINEFYS